MLFADDIVLIDKTQDDVNARLEAANKPLESIDFKFRRTKTENASSMMTTQEAEVKVRLDI